MQVKVVAKVPDTKKLLAPFELPTQDLLKEIDIACGVQMNSLREEAKLKSLANEELVIDTETMVWLKIIKAYGILYNRAVDAGWIQDVLTENK